MKIRGFFFSFIFSALFLLFPCISSSQEYKDEGFAPLMSSPDRFRLKPMTNGSFLKPEKTETNDTVKTTEGNKTDSVVEEKEHTLKYTHENWKKIEKQIDENTFREDEPVSTVISKNTQSEPAMPEPEITFKDSGTSMTVTGRKIISLNYSGKRYLKEQNSNTRERSTGLFEINQEMQIKMNGKVGEKISVNIDYDDTQTDKQDISVVYQGDAGEVVKQIMFGDVDFTLPATEFVSYNKQLFGIKAEIAAGGFNLSAVASRTKGETKTKQFTGNTEFQKIDIYDTSYLRRKYYDLTFGLSSAQSPLPIKVNSEKIYIDRQTSEQADGITIFSMTAEDYAVPSSSYSGRFRLLRRGVDYVVDYSNGIVTFSSMLASNAVVIIDYTKSNGVKLSQSSGTGLYKILKTKDDVQINNTSESGYKRELKTYYSIGQTNIVRDNSNGNFSLVVQDLSHNSVGETLNPRQSYSDTIEVDFEQGVFHLLKPFGSLSDPNVPDPQVYAASPSSKRLFHVEYSFKFKTFVLDSGIVADSETVYVDGKKYVKNSDYYIDYDSGFITFYNPDQISSSSVIDISYELSQFGGTGSQSIIGGRMSYNAGNILSLGSTVLYQGGTKGSSVPNITDMAQSMLVYEGDLQLKNLNLLGIKTSIGGELAVSKMTPNLDGHALVENMENSRQEDSAPLDKNYWVIAANPTSSPADPKSVNWDNENVKSTVINPLSTTDSSQDVLTIDYDFTLSDEISIAYPLSITGLDFSKKSTLEFVVYGDNENGPNFNIHFGQISEDPDNTGGQNFTCSSGLTLYSNPKSEDINCDGFVSAAEDIGWLYAPNGKSSKRFGAGNGRLDSADLNRNGRLDGEDFTGGSFGYNASEPTIFYFNNNTQTPQINFRGWRTLTSPMNITSTNTDRWNAIKQVRVSLKKVPGGAERGQIKIAKITAVGNTWNVNESTGTGKITVSAINNVDNYDYVPIYNVPGEPSRVFEDLYGSISDIKEKQNLETVSEQAMQVIYENITSSDTAYTYRTYTQTIDMAQHKYFKFLVRNDVEDDNMNMFLKAGSNDNYFKISIPMNFTGWRLISVEQYDQNGDSIPDYWKNDSNVTYNVSVSSRGVPSLQSISQFIFSVEVNDSEQHTGTILLDELFVEKPIERTGNARKLEGKFEVPGWFDGGGKYTFVDRNFQTPVTAITNQDREYTTGYLNIKRLNFFPINIEASRETTSTPNTSNTGSNNLVSSLSEGLVKKLDAKATGTLQFRNLPKLTLNYTKATVDYDLLSRKDDKDVYESALSYTMSNRIFFLPKSINANYSLTKNAVDYNAENLESVENIFNTEETASYYAGKLTFIPWNTANIIPSYSIKTVREKRSYLLSDSANEEYPKSLEQNVGFTSNLKIGKWFNPSVNYSISTTETNNLSTTTITVGISSQTYKRGEIKTITRSAKGGINLVLNFNDITPGNKLLKTMVISSSYQLEDGDSWYYVEKDYQTTNKLWIRNKLKPKNLQAYLNSLTIRDTYSSTLRWQPFDSYKITGKLAPLRTLSLTNNFTHTTQHSEVTGTVTNTANTTLPDVVMSISQLEDLFGISSKHIQNLTTNLKYSNNVAETKNISRTNTHNYSADLRAKVFSRIDSALTYTFVSSDDEDLETGQITQKSRDDGISLQGTFDWGKSRVTPKIDYTNSVTETTLGVKTKDIRTITPGILVKTDISLPKGLRLPFTKKIIVLSNRIVFTGNLSYAMSKSPVSVSDNNNLLSFTSSADYEITKNLRLTLNAGFQRYWAKKLPEEEYYSYEAGSTLSFQF